MSRSSASGYQSSPASTRLPGVTLTVIGRGAVRHKGGFTISTHSGLHPAPEAPELDHLVSGIAVGDLPPCVAPCPVLSAQLTQDMLGILNADRAQDGVRRLEYDARLVALSQWKALNLAANQYLDHNDHAPPIARAVQDRFAVYYPYTGAWGENLAYAFLTADTVMTAFMSDSGHRDNILNNSWRGVGLAVAVGGGLTFWAQSFGSLDPGPEPPPIPDPPPVPSGAVLDQWLTTVLPLIQATTQHQKWLASRTAAGKADVTAWNRYLQAPHSAVPVMKTPYGKALVADLHLAASQP